MRMTESSVNEGGRNGPGIGTRVRSAAGAARNEEMDGGMRATKEAKRSANTTAQIAAAMQHTAPVSPSQCNAVPIWPATLASATPMEWCLSAFDGVCAASSGACAE